MEDFFKDLYFDFQEAPRTTNCEVLTQTSSTCTRDSCGRRRTGCATTPIGVARWVAFWLRPQDSVTA
jgi:hypothetical protein